MDVVFGSGHGGYSSFVSSDFFLSAVESLDVGAVVRGDGDVDGDWATVVIPANEQKQTIEKMGARNFVGVIMRRP